MTIQEFAAYAGIDVKRAMYWKEQGLWYDGHVYFLEDYTTLALRKLIRAIPNHPSIALHVRREIYDAALELAPGEVAQSRPSLRVPPAAGLAP